MKLIIDIPDYNLNDIQNGSIACSQILKAVKNGVPYKDKPQGEWIVEKNKFGDILHCSICGARPRRSEYGYDLHDKFCNECGAKMKKGGAE